MQNSYCLKIYPKAQKDLDDIFNYIYNELCNPTATLKQIEDFEKSLETVCFAPFSCPCVNNEYIKDVSLRKLVVNNYIVFYRPVEEKETVEVVRVLYGMMNFKNIL